MSQIDNLNDARAEIRDLMRRVSQLERQSPIGFSSVTRGSLRIASAEGLIVEGSARISGTLNGDGSMSWTGPVEFVGPVTITGNVTRTGSETASGPTTLSGLFTVDGDAIFNTTSQATFNGPVDIKGATTVQGDLDVTGGGTIQAGAVTITPAGGGEVQVGSTTLASNGRISSSTGTNIISNDVSVEGELLQSLGPVVLNGIPSISTLQAGDNPVYARDRALFVYTG